LLAFAEFKKWFEAQPPNPNLPSKVGLYLHCYHSDKTGIKLHVACERLDLIMGKDVFLPIEDKYNNNSYSTQEINEVYNCLDAFVSTTTAEGWGLTITEAMSVGLPIICGNHTSLTEMTDNGELVYIVNDLIPHFQIEDAENVRMVLNPKAVTEQMINVFNDAPLKKWSVKNYQHKFEEYNWDKIADQWKISLKRLLKI
jgi:glycosyltransferase involved in cell wall biosynthesis